MRKMITKEVVTTVVKMARLDIVEGAPVAVAMEDLNLLGNISKDKAQKIINKRFTGVTVFEVVTKTKVYEMEIEKFIEMANLKHEDKEEAEKAEITELERKRDELQAKSKLKEGLEELKTVTKKQTKNKA